MGTLYRYFPSKVHLLVSALGREFSRIDAKTDRAAMTGGTPFQRLNSRPSADTSRCTFDGKYRYSVPTATSARSATDVSKRLDLAVRLLLGEHG
ncbi:hypothetical protein MAHJHV59_50190 [Mycobacterium avium subsp. hominissuis]